MGLQRSSQAVALHVAVLLGGLQIVGSVAPCVIELQGGFQTFGSVAQLPCMWQNSWEAFRLLCLQRNIQASDLPQQKVLARRGVEFGVGGLGHHGFQVTGLPGCPSGCGPLGGTLAYLPACRTPGMLSGCSVFREADNLCLFINLSHYAVDNNEILDV